MQRSPQRIWPGGHTHSPARQYWSLAHRVPQLPQWEGLSKTFTQAPLHMSCGGEHPAPTSILAASPPTSAPPASSHEQGPYVALSSHDCVPERAPEHAHARVVPGMHGPPGIEAGAHAVRMHVSAANARVNTELEPAPESVLRFMKRSTLCPGRRDSGVCDEQRAPAAPAAHEIARVTAQALRT